MSKWSALSTEDESRDGEAVRGRGATSFELTDRRQQEARERQRDRDDASDHENERGSLTLGEEGRSDRCDRREQRSTEVIHASHAAQKPPRHVDLQRSDPKDTEAREIGRASCRE